MAELPKLDLNYNTKPVRMIICPNCGNNRKHCAKGLCNIYYQGIRNRKIAKSNNLFF